MESSSLKRIPFRVEDELMIASMARWMGFIGIFVIVVSILGLFVMLLATMFGLLVLGGSGEIVKELGPLGTFLQENRWTVTTVAVSALLVNSLQIAAGYYLYWASRDFDNVAKTNEADQDFLARGLLRLKTTAKISTVVAVFQLIVNFAAGMSLTGLQTLNN